MDKIIELLKQEEINKNSDNANNSSLDKVNISLNSNFDIPKAVLNSEEFNKRVKLTTKIVDIDNMLSDKFLI